VAAGADSPLPNREIELWFEFGSNYSYLSVMRIEALASTARLDILWHPFLLGPIFKSFGWETSPFVLQPAKGAYVWKDMQRQCHKYGLAWTRPSVVPRPALLPARVAPLDATSAITATLARSLAAQCPPVTSRSSPFQRPGMVLDHLGTREPYRKHRAPRKFRFR
jgi:2-hydroxychromene-2-carboxylate isomerase